jgi:hypothetical protein
MTALFWVRGLLKPIIPVGTVRYPNEKTSKTFDELVNPANPIIVFRNFVGIANGTKVKATYGLVAAILKLPAAMSNSLLT